MAKLTLTDHASLTSNETSSVNTINANHALIETALENTLSRDGTSPNTMSANLDMNSNFIVNLPTPTNDSHAATKAYVDDVATTGVAGADGEDGTNGVDGEDGWTPVLAVVSDSARRVLQVSDWTGGAGTKPTTGQYVGASGLVTLVADAVDIRGATGLAGAGSGDMVAANNLSDVVDVSAARTSLGLGTIATQDANNVTITGGAISGITDLPVADGGTGASSAADARTNLGLVIGTHVQAYDAELAALAGLTSAADKGIQFTGAGTAATYDLTTAGKALLDDANAAAQRATLTAATTSQVFDWNVFIETPTAKDYKIVINSSFACTVNEITTITTAGTCTVTGKINTVALGGTANSASSVESTQTHASSNSVSAGDDIVLTISSVSSAANLSIKIKYTRTLA